MGCLFSTFKRPEKEPIKDVKANLLPSKQVGSTDSSSEMIDDDLDDFSAANTKQVFIVHSEGATSKKVNVEDFVFLKVDILNVASI